MEFGGFRVKNDKPVTTFYLIKGGGSPEFLVYNRPYEPAMIREPFPYWEILTPFGTDWLPPAERWFGMGADLAMYHWDPYAPGPAPDTIFAMRGAGEPFGLYRVSQNAWSERDNILPPGAWAGGALVSHPKWGDITFDGDSTDERGSILHCFRGSPPANPSKEFDCFDIKDHYPDGIWNGDPGNPAYFVSYGSDLVFGKVSYSWSGPTGSREGIWASFGNSTGQWYLGFRYRVQFPWWQEEGGGQSAPSGHPGTRGVTVGPNPVRGAVSFQSLCRGSGTVAIYTIAGQHVRSLTLLDGRCTWDLNDNDTRTVPEGIYFYLVRAGRNELRGKMTVQR